MLALTTVLYCPLFKVFSTRLCCIQISRKPTVIQIMFKDNELRYFTDHVKKRLYFRRCFQVKAETCCNAIK